MDIFFVVGLNQLSDGADFKITDARKQTSFVDRYIDGFVDPEKKSNLDVKKQLS